MRRGALSEPFLYTSLDPFRAGFTVLFVCAWDVLVQDGSKGFDEIADRHVRQSRTEPQWDDGRSDGSCFFCGDWHQFSVDTRLDVVQRWRSRKHNQQAGHVWTEQRRLRRLSRRSRTTASARQFRRQPLVASSASSTRIQTHFGSNSWLPFFIWLLRHPSVPALLERRLFIHVVQEQSIFRLSVYSCQGAFYNFTETSKSIIEMHFFLNLFTCSLFIFSFFRDLSEHFTLAFANFKISSKLMEILKIKRPFRTAFVLLQFIQLSRLLGFDLGCTRPLIAALSNSSRHRWCFMLPSGEASHWLDIQMNGVIFIAFQIRVAYRAHYLQNWSFEQGRGVWSELDCKSSFSESCIT